MDSNPGGKPCVLDCRICSRCFGGRLAHCLSPALGSCMSPCPPGPLAMIVLLSGLVGLGFDPPPLLHCWSSSLMTASRRVTASFCTFCVGLPVFMSDRSPCD